MNAFRQGAEWFNGRALRERVLLLITILVVIVFVGWELVVAPVWQQNRVLEMSVENSRRQVRDLQSQLTELQRQYAADPSAELRQTLALRKQRLAGLDSDLADATDRLIAPRAMVALLQDMLVARADLELTGVELLAPLPVYGEGAEGQAAEPLLYAHEVELTVSGGYLGVLGYLQELEALDQRLGWARLDYRVERFPQGEARIRVRTLSLQRAWLGV